MLSKAHRLTTARDFARLATKGRSIFGPFFTMRVREIKDKTPKVAFITSTKVFKRAVDRNRIKRRLRAIVRELFAEIPKEIHLLLVVKPEALKAEQAPLVAEVRRMLGKVPAALLEPPKMSPGAVKRIAKQKAKRAAGANA